MNPTRIEPPFKCIFCNSNENTFTSLEHIVPHSLGNNVLVMEKGWVCDTCNNICSAFESRVINHSLFGAERAMLGVITKKGKPARSKYGKLHWNAEPSMEKNVISIDKKELNKAPIFSNKIIIPVHDKYNYDVAKLLLKIGVEILSKAYYKESFLINKLSEAKKHIIKDDSAIWPYFVIRNNKIHEHIISIFESFPEKHKYITSLGIDIFLQDVDDDIILFFFYGNFKVGISLTSRAINWLQVLDYWRIAYVGCPIEFKNYSSV
ncbi:HNH endonuclease [Sulfurimonas sp.]|uniref:HNH endonuclease n=1 Tax=Sulfurimonas sp. TaxID=2022749 RepID=UPI003562D66C